MSNEEMTNEALCSHTFEIERRLCGLREVTPGVKTAMAGIDLFAEQAANAASLARRLQQAERERKEDARVMDTAIRSLEKAKHYGDRTDTGRVSNVIENLRSRRSAT